MKNEYIKLLFAVFIPPVGVAMETGFSKQLVLNIILTLLGYIPGVLHAFWVITRNDSQNIYRA